MRASHRNRPLHSVVPAQRPASSWGVRCRSSVGATAATGPRCRRWAVIPLLRGRGQRPSTWVGEERAGTAGKITGGQQPTTVREMIMQPVSRVQPSGLHRPRPPPRRRHGPPPSCGRPPHTSARRQDPLRRRAGHGHPERPTPAAETPPRHPPHHRHRQDRPRSSPHITMALKTAHCRLGHRKPIVYEATSRTTSTALPSMA